MFHRLLWWLGVATLGLQAGCATVVSSAVQGLTDDLSSAILDSEDVELVRDGAPAYLILIDGLVSGSDSDAAMLQTAAQLNSAYASAFVSEPERAKRMHAKARDLALRAACQGLRDGCDLPNRPYAEFEAWLAERSEKDVPLLYGLGGAWTGWLQVNSNDYAAIAELGQVKALMARVAELDPSYDNGGVYLYLGAFETLVGPAQGGRPEVGRAHFERAIELSGGRNLLAKVMFAESYARLVFDRELHDKLLGEVVETSAREPGLTLMNTVAQTRAKELLESADDYFFRSRILVALAALLLVGGAHAVTIKVATVSPDGSVWMKALRGAAAEVADRTEGRVKFRFYPGGVMGDDKAVLRKIRVGQLHGAVLTSGGMIAIDKNIQIYGLPLLMRSPEEVAAIREQFDQRLLDGLEENGFVSFGLAEVGFAYAMAQEPVTSVAQARDQKVWVLDNDPGSVRLLQDFGISGIPLSIADVLTGLQTGLINAIASPAVGAIALQWHTQLSHVMDLPLMYIYGSMVVSNRQFRKVDEADAAIVREVFGKAVAAVDEGARRDDESARNALLGRGIAWQAPSPEEASEWSALAEAANDQFAEEGFVDPELYQALQQALSDLRDG